MLVLFYFLAASPTPKSVAVGLSAVVPMPLGIWSCRSYPSQIVHKIESNINDRKKG